MTDINNKIEFLRRELEVVLQEKGTVDDPEVVSVSEMLEEALNNYHKNEKRKAKIRKHRLKQLTEINDHREK